MIHMAANSGWKWIGAAFLCSKLLLLLGYPQLGWNLLSPDLWVRWDSGHYIAIAGHGYEAFPCWTRFPDYAPGSTPLCGNCGWMPGFPLLIWFLKQLGLGAPTAAQLVVNSAILLFLSFLWTKVLRQAGTKGKLLLFLAACWPGAVYFQAAFPIALFVLMVGMCLYYLQKEALVPAMLTAAGASLAYSTGFLLGAAVVPYILFRYRKNFRELIQYLLIPFCSLLSFALVLGVQWMQTGVFGAFFQTQSKYGHGLNSPLKILGLIAKRAYSTSQFEVQFTDGLTLVLSAGCLLLILWFITVTRDHSRKMLLIGYLICFWFIPLSMSPHLAFYRQAAALAPLVLFLEALPRRGVIAFLIFSIGINPILARLFLMDLLP